MTPPDEPSGSRLLRFVKPCFSCIKPQSALHGTPSGPSPPYDAQDRGVPIFVEFTVRWALPLNGITRSNLPRLVLCFEQVFRVVCKASSYKRGKREVIHFASPLTSKFVTSRGLHVPVPCTPLPLCNLLCSPGGSNYTRGCCQRQAKNFCAMGFNSSAVRGTAVCTQPSTTGAVSWQIEHAGACVFFPAHGRGQGVRFPGWVLRKQGARVIPAYKFTCPAAPIQTSVFCP